MSFLRITRGDDYVGVRRLIVTIRDANGALVDLSGSSATFMVKRHFGDPDDDAVISASLENDANQTTNRGKAYVPITGTDTDDLDDSVPYFYEIQSNDAVGIITLASGRLSLVGDLIRDV